MKNANIQICVFNSNTGKKRIGPTRIKYVVYTYKCVKLADPGPIKRAFERTCRPGVTNPKRQLVQLKDGPY